MELQEILNTLDSLQSRVQAMTETDLQGNSDSGTPDSQDTPVFSSGGSLVGVGGPSVGPLSRDLMSLLRAGMSELSNFTQMKEFPEYFLRLSNRTGLRLLLLKRWTTGLQVIVERNISLPDEAKKKRPDGKAPIPVGRSDLFEALQGEAYLYCGPVPIKHFPLDLTLLLGRGSKDRRIIVLPLPSQNHWNTFLYLDADRTTEKALAVAEVLAHFAMVRMHLLNKGVVFRQGKVAAILKEELYRRQQDQARLAGGGMEPEVDVPAGGQFPETKPQLPVQPGGFGAEDLLEDHPFQEEKSEQPAADSVPEAAEAIPPDPTELPEWEQNPVKNWKISPQAILRQSGELPALPKAACHIMAVIEDPKTTATRLEKALVFDQALTAKVLRIANSPFYGAVREIRTVSEAIVRLGFVTIRNWTLVTAARSIFLAPGSGMLYQKIWRQSVLSAMAGQLVAQYLRGEEPESVFIGGLMQNIGQLVLARSNPELFQEILGQTMDQGAPYHEVERALLGFDHGELGALLIREWNLSPDLEDAVRWHHRFEEEGASNTKVAAMIALGEEIALCSSYEDQEQESVVDTNDPDAPAEPESPELPSAAAKFLGLTEGKLAELKDMAAKLHIDPHFFN